MAVKIANIFSFLPFISMFHTGEMLGALLFFENSIHQGSSSKLLQAPL
jgi:hypothetical protein